MNDYRQKLLPLVQKAAKFGDFTLASGQKSDFYFDGRLVTCSAQGAYYLGQLILEILKDSPVTALGGLTMGADPIAAATAALSVGSGHELDCFLVRKEPKGHGTKQLIEGHCPREGAVCVVDDVVTTAASTLKAIQAVENHGAVVSRVICLLDREEGGAQALDNYDFQAIFRKSQLLELLGA